MTTIKTLSTREEHMRDATLHIIGTGPGDPDLLTLKALKTLKACPIIAAPKATPGGSSTALAIVSQVVDLAGKDIFELYFPMKKIRAGKDPDKEVSLAWQAAAARIIACLDQGLDVAFPTLGDPAIYSTGYYLYDTLLSLRPDVRVKFHAGIPAMSCCSAETKMPICLGNEMLAVVPATFSDERLRSTLEKFDTIVSDEGPPGSAQNLPIAARNRAARQGRADRTGGHERRADHPRSLTYSREPALFFDDDHPPQWRFSGTLGSEGAGSGIPPRRGLRRVGPQACFPLCGRPAALGIGLSGRGNGIPVPAANHIFT